MNYYKLIQNHFSGDSMSSTTSTTTTKMTSIRKKIKSIPTTPARQVTTDTIPAAKST